MTRDEWVVAVVMVSFATWVTTHLALVVGLASREPRWRALVALIVAPLAPYWGLRSRLVARSLLWMGGAGGYALARWLARR